MLLPLYLNFLDPGPRFAPLLPLRLENVIALERGFVFRGISHAKNLGCNRFLVLRQATVLHMPPVYQALLRDVGLNLIRSQLQNVFRAKQFHLQLLVQEFLT